MKGVAAAIGHFIWREKIYIALFAAVVFINLSLSFLSGFLRESGLAERLEGSSQIFSGEALKKAVETNPTAYFIFLYLAAAFVFFILVGIIFDVVYFIMTKRGYVLVDATKRLEGARWNLWDICKVAIIFLFAQRVLWLIDLFFISSVPFLHDKESLRLVFSATMADIIAIAALIYFVVDERGEALDSLGLTARKMSINVRYGILAYVGLGPILVAVMMLTTTLFKKYNIPMEPQPVLVILQSEKHVPSLVFMGLFTAVFGPVLEEVFFRGFAYGVFRRRLGIFWGIVASAFFFASIHGNLASFFPILALGITLTYLYEKTGSLVASITVHILHNSISLALLILLKGIAR
ncbi:MAG: CPBP family intramembrane metalloprotease [Candidatus Omnitrophica bacterium]|nr:CPBP family intramembrane metalloprotease [Candidatus Omnitrophota bacterium]